MTRAAHHPPAVRYPLVRATAVPWCIAAVAAGGLVLLIAWFLQSAVSYFAMGLALLGWVVTAGAAVQSWRGSTVGTLSWNGEQWMVESAGGASALGHVHAVLDLQRFLLLQWVPMQGQTAWLALERGQHPFAWDDVRRAVYSRPRPQASGAGAAPSAPRDGA